MTKVSRKKNRIKLLVLASLAVLLVAGGILLYLEKSRRTDLVKMPGNSPSQTKKEKKQEAKMNADSKQEYLDEAYSKDNQDSQTNSPAPQTSSQNLSVEARQEGSNVVVLTKIQGVTSGTCKLSVSNGSSQTSQTAQIIYQPEFSSCAGFSVPVSSIDKGIWKITITVNDNPELTKQISLEVR